MGIIKPQLPVIILPDRRLYKGPAFMPMIARPSQLWQPRTASAPFRQHPGRREHVYGRIHPMNCKCGACG